MRVPRQSGQDWLCSTKYEGYLWSDLWRSVLAWDKIRFWADILCFLGIISLYGALFCFRILLTSVFINLGPGCCPLSGFFIWNTCLGGSRMVYVICCDPIATLLLSARKRDILTSHLWCGFITMKGLL